MKRAIAFALALFAFGCCVTHVAGCTPDARRALLETTVDAATCAIKNMNLPDTEIVKVCAIEAADIDRILRIVGEARGQAALAAVYAENRVAASHCSDAGTK